MNFKRLPFITTICFSLVIFNCTSAQNWKEFANIERYSKANAELLEKAHDENRIVFMGNSITEAWPIVSPDFFKNKSYISRGISGQTTPQMLLRFRNDVIDLNPKIVILLAGTNDIAGNTGKTSITTIASNIKSMAELADKNGIKVIISSVLPAIDYPWKPGLDPATKIVKLNNKLKEYAKKNNYIYLDYYSSLVDEKGGLKVPDYTSAADLVHPNREGYLVMEKLVKAAISKVLED